MNRFAQPRKNGQGVAILLNYRPGSGNPDPKVSVAFTGPPRGLDGEDRNSTQLPELSVSQNVAVPSTDTHQRPGRSPSYPQRIHVRERPQWRAVLEKWEGRIRVAATTLETTPADHPSRPSRERMFNQMLGARDQIADAVRRLPGVVGVLYEEDRHKLDEAVASLERIFTRWK
jgi:hypothetical protein